MAGSEQRKPKRYHKTRTGCGPCRARRVKCDETKPICHRCRISKASCSYSLTPQFSAPTAAQHIRWVLGSQPGVSTLPVAVGGRTTWDERRISHLFRTEVIDFIAGAFDGSFWMVNLLQAVHKHPVLWYAANAVTAMYQRYNCKERTPEAMMMRNELYKLSLLDYNKCIKYFVSSYHTKVLTLEEKTVILTTTALLTALCSLSGDFNEAYIHTKNGLELFRKWEIREQKDFDDDSKDHQVLPIDSLVALFTRIGNATVHYNWSIGTVVRKGKPELSRVPFDDITEAYVSFEAIVNGMLGVLMSNDGMNAIWPCVSSYHAYRAAFMLWEGKFEHFIAQLDRQCDWKETAGILTLQVRRHSLHIATHIEYVTADLSRLPLAWDMFITKFRKIIRVARQLYQHLMENRDVTFSFAPAAIEALSLVGMNCRDRVIRREAIQLLKTWPSTELLIDPRVTAAVVEAVMLKEEAGITRDFDRNWCECIAGGFICLGHRARHTGLRFTKRGTASFTLMNVNDMQTRGPGSENCIQITSDVALSHEDDNLVDLASS